MANNKQCPTCGQEYTKHSTNKEVNETPIEELIEKHTGMKYEDYLKHKEAEKQRIWQKYSPD
jgi:hypothetical protein